MVHLRDWISESDTPALDTGIAILLMIFCLFAPHSIAITQGAFYAALLLWLMRMIRRRRLEYTASVFDRPVIAFVILTGLSAIFSYERPVSVEKLGSVSLVLIYFLVAQQVRTRALAKALVIVMLASCLVNVGYVFWQKVQGRGLRIVQMRPESPLAAAGLTLGDVILEVDDHSVRSLPELLQLARRSDQGAVTLFVYRPEIYFRRTLRVGDWKETQDLGVKVTPWHQFRAAGFYGWNYFTYAEVLQLLAAIAFGLLLRVRDKRSGMFMVLVLVVASMGAAITLTVTRAVWIAFAGALVMMSLRIMNKWAVLIILAVGLATAPVALKTLQQTRGQPLLSVREPSTAYRLTVWKEGLSLLVARPKHLALGIGMDSLKYRWREWGLFQGGKLPLGHMHSTPLQIALERGVPALICWVWWFGAYVWLLWRLSGREAGRSDWISQGIGLGVFGGTLGFLASSLVHYNFGDSEVVMIVYFLMGISAVMYREPGTSPVKRVTESTSQ
jgi:O-antigen ligase